MKQKRNDNFSKKKKKKKQYLNFYKWTSLFFLSLTLISSSVLIYQQLTLRNQSQALKEQAQRQYLLQEINLISTNELVNSPKINAFFTDLLRNYAEKFAKNKNLSISPLSLKFVGLHSDSNTGNGYGKMGRCWKEQGTAKIGLNRLYLLNKFGHDRYFTSNPQDGDYSYLEISFDRMINTCSHEIAHYIQLVKHGKSSCESDLKLNNENYDKELAKEHEKWTKEIYRMIKNSGEYLELERKWNYIE